MRRGEGDRTDRPRYGEGPPLPVWKTFCFQEKQQRRDIPSFPLPTGNENTKDYLNCVGNGETLGFTKGVLRVCQLIQYPKC